MLKKIKEWKQPLLLIGFIILLLGGIKTCQIRNDIKETVHYVNIPFIIDDIYHYTYEFNDQYTCRGRYSSSCPIKEHFKLRVHNEYFKDVYVEISETNYYKNKEMIDRKEIPITYQEIALQNGEKHTCITEVIGKKHGSYLIKYHVYNDKIQSFQSCTNTFMNNKDLDNFGKYIYGERKASKDDSTFKIERIQ